MRAYMRLYGEIVLHLRAGAMAPLGDGRRPLQIVGARHEGCVCVLSLSMCSPMRPFIYAFIYLKCRKSKGIQTISDRCRTTVCTERQRPILSIKTDQLDASLFYSMIPRTPNFNVD
jgi:hypothetical protein